MALGAGSFPEDESAASEVLSLLISLEFANRWIEEVAGAVRRFHGG